MEGVLRENCIEKGLVSDSAIYGLLRSDWKDHDAYAAQNRAHVPAIDVGSAEN